MAKSKNYFSTSGPKIGCFPCGDCCACRNIVRTNSFNSADGSREFKIRDYISCNTTNVVYLATCGCDKAYVGLTSRELKTRTREHVRDILAAREIKDIHTLKTIPRHYKLVHNSDPRSFHVRGIEAVYCGIRGGDVRKILAQKEARWIDTLGTMAPAGLNEQLSFTAYL